MKEMVYSDGNERKCETLDKGTYKGYDYLIVSYGTHPCCYIRIPSDSPWYKHDYEDIDLCVHGGLTFAHFFSKESAKSFGISPDDWYIGWDYSHYEDYSGYLNNIGARKWTTEMLLDEVHRAIEDLIDLPIQAIRLKPYVWYPCNDETDVEVQDNQVRLFYLDGIVYEDNHCPFGWNVLEKNNAQMMIINKPE